MSNLLVMVTATTGNKRWVQCSSWPCYQDC